MLNAYRKPFTSLVEEGTYISSQGDQDNHQHKSMFCLPVEVTRTKCWNCLLQIKFINIQIFSKQWTDKMTRMAFVILNIKLFIRCVDIFKSCYKLLTAITMWWQLWQLLQAADMGTSHWGDYDQTWVRKNIQLLVISPFRSSTPCPPPPLPPLVSSSV